MLRSQPAEAAKFGVERPAAQLGSSPATDAIKRRAHLGAERSARAEQESIAARLSRTWATLSLRQFRQRAHVVDAARAPGTAAYDGQRSQVVPLFSGGVFDPGYNAGRAPKLVPLPAGGRRVLLVSVITGVFSHWMMHKSAMPASSDGLLPPCGPDLPDLASFP